MREKATLVVNHPVYMAYINGWLATRPGRSVSDLLKDTLDLYMATFPLGKDGTDPTILAAACSIYKLIGEIGPDTLQRRLHISYQQAVDVLKELVASGAIPADKVRELVDMGVS